MQHTKIEWAHHTFNPWIGCAKVSPGCANCYADARNNRFNQAEWRKDGYRHRTSSGAWKSPSEWNRAAETEGEIQRVFCASLADIFEMNEKMPLNKWRRELHESLILKTPWLRWLLLTKRPENISRCYGGTKIPSNVWLGTSVESQQYADERIPHLLANKCAVHFLSCEPLLGRVNLRTYLGPDKINWVIVGGESGPDWRPMDEAWVLDIRDQCQEAGVAFFFKQRAALHPHELGRELEGRTWDEFPVDGISIAPKIKPAIAESSITQARGCQAAIKVYAAPKPERRMAALWVPILNDRTPSEIIAMEFSPEDLYVPNGVIAKGQPSTIIGPAGVGKSRLLLQLAVCAITGRDFIGWHMKPRAEKWLIIQTENSNRRYQKDMKALKAWLGSDAFAVLDERLILHTLEEEHDHFLNLDDENNAALIAELVAHHKAGVVAFDPLNAFSVGNLNTDAAMLKTCRTMHELARRGNPDACVIVLHHAHAGSNGARAALGIDRGMYGRGSKTLYGWTRGQINIAPASPENPNKLVVTCGKNSNGEDFAPFGIALNPATMIYERDDTFDLITWKEEMAGGAPTAAHKPTPKNIAELLRGNPMKRKALSEEIMEEFGCGKSNAYRIISQAENLGTIKKNEERQYQAA